MGAEMFHDDELCALAKVRAKLAETRAALTEVGLARRKEGVPAEDIENADDELREFDGGMYRAEQRRKRNLTVFSSRRK